MMRRWFARLWSWLRSWFLRPALPSTAYRAMCAAEDPAQLAERCVYVVGENGHCWHATFLCPCGCADVIALNLLPDDLPCWEVTIKEDRPTLHPSINRTNGCRSHFFVRDGEVSWCGSADTK